MGYTAFHPGYIVCADTVRAPLRRDKSLVNPHNADRADAALLQVISVNLWSTWWLNGTGTNDLYMGDKGASLYYACRSWNLHPLGVIRLICRNMVAKQRHRHERRDSISFPQLEVVIEIPCGSFLKRGSTGKLDFVSPFPCPFNYGSAEKYIGLEGDLLDAVVLGTRLRRGTRVTVRAYGAVGLTDRGLYDDKLICSHRPVEPWQRFLVLLFFRIYARCKGLLNILRGRPGRNACEGWCEAKAAIARARPRIDRV